MAVNTIANYANFNYLEEDSENFTTISVFKYARNRPNQKSIRTPVGFITLPLPLNLGADHYSMQLADENLGTAGFLTEKIGQGSILTQLRDTLRERIGTQGGNEIAKGFNASDITNLAIVGMANAPGIGDIAKFVGESTVNTVKATAGITRNPHTTLLFNNVNLRTFTFQWRLSPRSAEQSQKLNNIIAMIKKMMHPNITLEGFALDYPNLVTVNFNNDKEGIMKVDYAFIQDFEIDGTPQGHVYYKEKFPTFIDIKMTVKETRIKTAEDFTDVDFNNNQTPGSARAGSTGI